ncbi:MAG: class I SAM-dependent methyltransferase [Ktedonobacteraceae bacterium]|nr:class I SAM-dependent methyltransferase [Ktedonobacteraceae bacterium]
MLPDHFSLEGKKRILDVACGPGEWGLTVASRYFPDVSVCGIDNSEPMIEFARAQAHARELTHQTSFYIMNILELPLNLPAASFDLVNLRFISGLLPREGWRPLFEECYRLTHAGGMIRSTEADVWSMPECPANNRFAELIVKAVWLAGQGFDERAWAVVPMIGKFLVEAGYEDIHSKAYALDYSYGTPLHKPISENFEMSYALLRPFLLRMKIADAEEIDRLIDASRQERERVFSSVLVSYKYLCNEALEVVYGLMRGKILSAHFCILLECFPKNSGKFPQKSFGFFHYHFSLFSATLCKDRVVIHL